VIIVLMKTMNNFNQTHMPGPVFDEMPLIGQNTQLIVFRLPMGNYRLLQIVWLLILPVINLKYEHS